MPDEILEVHPFPKNQPPRIEFMLLPLQTLFTQHRYAIDTPQRLHSYLIVLFTKGQGQHYVDFRAYPYQEKTLLFVAENQVHQWEIHLNHEAFILAFSKEFLYQSMQDRDLLQRYRIFDYALESPTLQLDEDDYPRFKALFEELRQEVEHSSMDAFKHEIYRNLLRVILVQAERRKCQTLKPPALAQYQEFVRFREQVEQTFHLTRHVKDYSQALGYSPKKLNQITLESVNKNAKVFIDERAILEIKRLLIHTNLSVKEIADRIGFDEPSNLVKFFKRYTGQTPLAFREALSASFSPD